MTFAVSEARKGLRKRREALAAAQTLEAAGGKAHPRMEPAAGAGHAEGA